MEVAAAAALSENGTEAPQSANTGAPSPEIVPKQPAHIHWREQLPVIKHEINEQGGVSPTLTRQQARALLRRMAKITAADLNGRRRHPSRRPNKADNEFRVADREATERAAIREANARNGVG